MCICPRGFTNRGRGRGVHSRNEFLVIFVVCFLFIFYILSIVFTYSENTFSQHNQEGHASSNFPNAGRGRGFIRPTYTHTHPCYKVIF